jgi:hypothetical protein
MRWPVRISQPGSGGGPPPPGDSLDRFAPKYLVGCTAAPYNDTADETGTAAGFTYIADTGDGLGIATALGLAAAVAADVWIRPGTYTVSQTLTVPIGVTVRGSGVGTIIQSAPNTIAGPLFSLNDRSALYSMSLVHNEPVEADPLVQYGVVDLRGDAKTALCEDVDVATIWANPTNTTLYGGFVAYNLGGGSGGTKLRCVRCSVQYGKNNASTPSDYTTNLVGYRGKDASVELTDCSSQYLAFAVGYGVILVNSNTGIDVSLVARGGTFNGYGGGIYADADGGAVTTMLVDGAKISCADQNNSSTCVGNIGAVRITLSNCTLNGGGAGQAIYLDPGTSPITDNKGSIVGNTINVANPTKAWRSEGGVNSGYHVIIGNTYTSTAAVVTGANDEVAHNINI